MSGIQWATLICDVDEHGRSTGRISHHRLRKTFGILAALFGLAVVVIATLMEVVTKVEVPTDMIMILVAACLVPVTGGQISDAIFGSRLSQKIITGEARGRRTSDVGLTAPRPPLRGEDP